MYQNVSLKFLPNNMNLVPCVRPSQLLAHTERMSGLAARLLYEVASYLCGKGEGKGERGERESEGKAGGREEEEGRKLRKGGRRRL